MNWKYVVPGGLLLVLAGLFGAADYVSTSITTDGSFLLASSGPILVSDYASGRRVTALPETIACVFTKYVLNQEPKSELFSMGILSKGRYATSRVAGPGLTGRVSIQEESA